MKVKDLREVCDHCYLVDPQDKEAIGYPILDFKKMITKRMTSKYDEKEVLLIDYYQPDELYGFKDVTVLIAFVKDLNT